MSRPNEWGIPELDLAMQAERLVAPVTKWGTRRRTDPMPGTWHFYCWDFHFTHLWSTPDLLIRSGPAVAVEPNYSTHEGMPRAEALWGIFRKRTLAAHWQSRGVRVVVDLNLHPSFRDIGLLGVPPGWRAYATRAHRDMPVSEIEAEHALAVAHAGTLDILFAVFGGGRKRVKPVCDRWGWAWVPEHRQVVAGKAVPYG